jgi:energy-coupling factor transport system permease protein
LIVFGFGWGFLYGAIINLWFWPLAVGPAEQYWQPGIGVGATLERYAVYYAATSAWWDFFGGAGNALLIALVGLPTLRALERFRLRMIQPPSVGAGLASAQPPALLGQEAMWRATDVEPPAARVSTAEARQAAVEHGLHPLTWLIWLGAALIIVMSTRNPLYLIEVLLIARIVSARTYSDEHSREVWKPTLRFALFLILIGALINALSSRFGATVLLDLPDRQPLIGGPVTLEAIVYGANAGLSLVVMLVLFAVFNQSLSAHQLVRLSPRAFHGAGVTLSIALTYVPATRHSLNQIREAQAVRGHQLRSWRDWLPLWMPLLVSGLERAFQLAEAMVARGFGATSDRPASTWLRAGLIGGLIVLLAGEVLSAFLPNARALSNPLLIAGAAALAIFMWLAGRAVPYTPYRSHPWRMGDAIVVAGAVLSFAAIVWPGLGASCGEILGCRAGVAFTPYPALTLPGFDPLVGLALLGLLLPAWVANRL